MLFELYFQRWRYTLVWYCGLDVLVSLGIWHLELCHLFLFRQSKSLCIVFYTVNWLATSLCAILRPAYAHFDKKKTPCHQNCSVVYLFKITMLFVFFSKAIILIYLIVRTIQLKCTFYDWKVISSSNSFRKTAWGDLHTQKFRKFF